MIRPICLQLRTQLQEIKELKVEFDLELPKIKDTRDTSLALSLEEKVREKIKSIKELLVLTRCEWAETTIGGKSKEEIIRELEDREKSNNPEDQISIRESSIWSMIQNSDFIVTSQPEKITLIRLKVKDLGFKQEPTTDQLYNRAKELGLELCPPEIGPHLRLNYKDVFKRRQSELEPLYIAMNPICPSSSNEPSVFSVYCDGFSQRWLDNRWVRHGLHLKDDDFYSNDEWVFCIRQ